MKNKESNEISKKIRTKLIYYTYLELKKKFTESNQLLINSKTPKELNNKYQKVSDYCVKKIETYGINNYNYCHVSVTYYSPNNNYRMLVDKQNVDQYRGKNNLVGKYYKGNSIQIRTKRDNPDYIITSNNMDNLEKKVIGADKFIKRHRSIASSLDIQKRSHIIDNINNICETETIVDNLRSNNDLVNIKKLIRYSINNEKIGANCENKIVNKYKIELKKYCSYLIKIDKKNNFINNVVNISKKNSEFISPSNNSRQKRKKDKNFKTFRNKPKIKEQPPPPILHQNSNINHSNVNLKLIEGGNHFLQKKEKCKTKLMKNYKLQNKKSIPNKSISPKRLTIMISPKNNISKFGGLPTSNFYNLYQKFKKGKATDVLIRKFTSGNKINFPSHRRKLNMPINNGIFKLDNSTNKNNQKLITNIFRINSNTHKNNITKKGRFAKSLTLKKNDELRAGDTLDKKIKQHLNKEKK